MDAQPIVKLCGAKTKSREGNCRRRARENGRCKFHGGLTPRGIASPHLLTGRWSKDLPALLAARYQQARSDENLLDLREEIALVDARLGELLSSLKTDEASGLWKTAREAFQKFRSASRKDDREQIGITLAELDAAICGGFKEESTWILISELMEQRRKLVESERKRAVELHQMITVDKAMVLIAALSDIIRRHVKDPAALSAISGDLIRLVGPAAGGENSAA